MSLRSEETIGDVIRLVFYIVSLLIPVAGFIIGAIYYRKSSQELKAVGRDCLALACVGIVLSIWCWALPYIGDWIFGVSVLAS